MNDNATLPSEVNLDSLFHRRSIFGSVEKLSEAGFQIVKGSTDRVTVFGHASLPGYLFKKFLRTCKRPPKKLIGYYEKRVQGARSLKAHLDDLDINSIVVPRKWLCELPSRCCYEDEPKYIIIVEKYNLLKHEESLQRYRHIPKSTIRDLCTIFFTFKGVDFAAKNMPFTSDGKIACVDTGCFQRITEDLSFRRDNYRKHVERLHVKLHTGESKRYADALWDVFKKHGVPYR